MKSSVVEKFRVRAAVRALSWSCRDGKDAWFGIIEMFCEVERR